jgi:hypothetical protein
MIVFCSYYFRIYDVRAITHLTNNEWIDSTELPSLLKLIGIQVIGDLNSVFQSIHVGLRYLFYHYSLANKLGEDTCYWISAPRHYPMTMINIKTHKGKLTTLLL